MTDVTLVSTTSESAPGPRVEPMPAVGLALGFAVIALMLAALAIGAPMPLAVFGLALFGIVHICLELRYVIGRFAGPLAGRFGWLLVLALSLMVLTRLVATLNLTLGRQLEAAGAFVLLGLAAWIGLSGRSRLAVLIGLAGLAVVCLYWPSWYWAVITHLHNFIPLAFLWDWSSRFRWPGERLVFMAGHAVWAVLVPALIMSGALDGWINLRAGLASSWVGDGAAIIASAQFPGISPEIMFRAFVVFAFLQSMHYVVWIGFFPWQAPEVSARFGRAAPALRGWRLPLLAAGLGAAVFVAFVSDYRLGRQIYSLVSTYHVYLEFPILVFMLVGWGALGLGARAGDVRPASPGGH